MSIQEESKTLSECIEVLEELIVDAKIRSAETSRIAHNSYGAGSDFGELQGLRRALAVLKNE